MSTKRISGCDPFGEYTEEEQPVRQQFLAEHPNWDCERDKHVIGDMIPTPQGFAATGCCWVCGKAVC